MSVAATLAFGTALFGMEVLQAGEDATISVGNVTVDPPTVGVQPILLSIVLPMLLGGGLIWLAWWLWKSENAMRALSSEGGQEIDSTHAWRETIAILCLLVGIIFIIIAAIVAAWMGLRPPTGHDIAPLSGP